ncbi:MAG: DUF4179 domain-containing protein [Slackia sp.]|nr:DUF4179 domain-containing protein [Slackia sp.]
MNKTYRQALDDMAFSEETADHMTNDLARAIAERQKSEAREAIAASPAPAAARPRPVGGRTPHLKKRWQFVAAAGLAGALLIGSAGAIAATGALTTVNGLIDDIFNGAPASTEIVDAIGRPIGASASCNGITVTADAVVGDRWNYVVVFSIARDDGKPFDVTPNENGTLPLMFDGPSGIHVDWMVAGGGGIHFYDADPDDNAVQMVQSMSADTFGGKSIIGNTARVHLENLYALDDSGERRLVAEGSWDIKFEMNYDDTTIDLPSGFSVDYNDLSADIESAAISPIGITVDYTAHDVMDWQEQESGKMSGRNAAEMDRIMNLPILISLSDGTVIDATESGSASQANDNGTTSVHKTYVFDVFADPEEVTSVTIGGKEVWQTR